MPCRSRNASHPFASSLATLLILSAPCAAQSVISTLHGSTDGERYGAAVAGAGDVDADGHADFVIGAPGDATAGTDAGAAHVISGKTGLALYDWYDGFAFSQLGSSVASAGDIDADGYSDLIVARSAASGASAGTRVARERCSIRSQAMWSAMPSARWSPAAATSTAIPI